MEIISGLMNHQVLQRNSKNLCETTVIGKCAKNHNIEIRVKKNSKLILGVTLKTRFLGDKSLFEAKLTGIETGGPYEITLIAGSEKIVFEDIRVGDLWILAGQSNMEGMGNIADAAKPDENVRALYMDDRWAVAKDPIHNLNEAVDPVHADLNEGLPVERAKHVGAGPGVAFAKRMAKLTGVPQGLIPCAHGGTSLNQWSPALKNKKGKSLYGAMLRRFNLAGKNVAGVIWYQGCSDACDRLDKQYTAKMKKFIESVRTDFRKPKLPFVMAQIAGMRWNRLIEWAADLNDFTKQWNSIQQQQLGLADQLKNVSIVSTIDLSMEDEIHLSGKDQQRLGKRLADAAMSLKPPVKPKTIKTTIQKTTNTWNIEVTFANVKGKLISKGKPAGFSLAYLDGSLCDAIYRTGLNDSKAILKTALPTGKTFKLNLHYGLGLSPYCNICDEADHAALVFGPVEISFKN